MTQVWKLRPTTVRKQNVWMLYACIAYICRIPSREATGEMVYIRNLISFRGHFYTYYETALTKSVVFKWTNALKCTYVSVKFRKFAGSSVRKLALWVQATAAFSRPASIPNCVSCDFASAIKTANVRDRDDAKNSQQPTRVQDRKHESG